MTHLQECGGGGGGCARRPPWIAEPACVCEAGMQGVAWYLEEKEWNPGSRQEGVQGSLEGIHAERLEVSREGANRQLGAEGWWDQGQRSFLFRDTGSGKSVSWEEYPQAVASF